MSVDAKIEMKDGTTVRKNLIGMEDLMLWLMKHPKKSTTRMPDQSTRI